MPEALIAQKFPEKVIPLINEARHSIRVIVFDWRFYPSVLGSTISQFNTAIARAAARGVDVRALVNNDGVVDRLKAIRCKAKRLHSTRLLHTKMMIIDDTKIILGSHNYTQHGFAINHEVSVVFDLTDIDNDFVKYFEALWGV